MQDDVQRRIRDGVTSRPVEVHDDIDCSDVSRQAELDLALLQMKTDGLSRIDAPLRRLAAGDYGTCAECADDISCENSIRRLAPSESIRRMHSYTSRCRV